MESYLPVELRTPPRAAAAAVAAPEAPSPSPAFSGVVLAVDDLPENLQTASQHPRPFGYEVLAARGFAEAMARLDQRVPDLILSDIHMPGVVDDNPTNRELLTSLLGYSGEHRLLEADDGVQALVLARKERPDLVIADILMPRMDGYEFARELRSDPDTGGAAVIFYTAA
ncbi:MAG: response regulator [Actinomycetota bacterium]